MNDIKPNTILAEKHQDHLKASAISTDVIEARGYETVADKKRLAELGFSPAQQQAPGLLIPHFNVGGDIVGHDYKPDNARTDAKGKLVKYEKPKNSKNHFDIHPHCTKTIGDPSTPLYFVEGTKKGDALVSHDVCAIAMSGCYGWRGENINGGKTAIADLENIAVNGRIVYLIPDPDYRTNNNVQEGWDRFARLLTNKGAKVSIIIPPLKPDDFLAAGQSIAELNKLARPYNAMKITKPRPPNSQADDLVNIADSNCLLFHTENDEPFAALSVRDHREIWSVKSNKFKHWLNYLCYKETGKSPGSDAFNSALNVISGKACFDGKEIKLHNRCAWHNGDLYYDLSNDNWQMVKITPQGWEVIDSKTSPIIFRRYGHQAAQVTPKHGGDAKKLLDFINIGDSGRKQLFLSTIITNFHPDYPRPLVCVYGSHGSAKTTYHKVVRSIVDPSLIPSSSFPRDLNELAQKLHHQYYCVFDNVSYIPDWASDALCRAITGDGFSKRQLYTDGDDIIWQFMRIIGINGISIPINKADLLDRSILLELERIPTENRMPEQEFWQSLEIAKPQILGGIFDTLSKSMAMKSETKLFNLPRMADFCIWGCAVSKALGYGGTEFYNNYTKNMQHQNQVALETSPVGKALMVLMEQHHQWNGFSSELYSVLTSIADAHSLGTKKQDGWPGAAHIMGRRIDEIRPNLRDTGILIREDRSDRGKTYFINHLIDEKNSNSCDISSNQKPINVAAVTNDAKTLMFRDIDKVKDNADDTYIVEPFPKTFDGF